MVVPRGIVAAAQVVGYALGMAGVPCVEYGVVGQLRAALLRQLAAVGLYGATLLAFLALLTDLQGGDLPGQGGDAGGTLAMMGWLLALAALLSYALAYSAPRLDPRATLRYLCVGAVTGALLIGVCVAVFLWIGGTTIPAALGAGVIVAASFLSAGFAFLVVPLVAPRKGSRPVVEYGLLALLVGFLLAILPRMLFLLNVPIG